MLALTGNKSYTGGTQINAGVAQGSANSLSGDISLAASTVVILDQADSATYVHNITGALNVGGTSTAGSIAGAVLGGHGRILDNVNVKSGATVAPGNSIETLTVNSTTLSLGAPMSLMPI